MAEVLQPADAGDVAEAVAGLAAQGRPAEILGHGTRRRLGAPSTAETRLDLSHLGGVVDYEPNELVLTVRPATPLAEVEALLAGERQQLAFEPPDYGPLWGEAAGLGTVGGVVGVGHGGPRRPFAGAPRDHLLGFKAVGGRGEPFAAGGRVVKNVTGFDLPKLMAGSFGTLGVVTELTLKVLPAPEAACTLAFHGLDDGRALALLRQAVAGPIPLGGAAHLPEEAAPDGRAVTYLRLEGMAQVLAATVGRLRGACARLGGDCEILDVGRTAELWRTIGGAAPFAGSAGAVWRVSVPASAAERLGARWRGHGLRLFYDWGGRLIWVEAPADAALGGGELVRGALAELAPDGHASLVRGDEALRRAVAPLQPPSPGVARLSARLKTQLDPLGLFNPGRMGVF